MNRFIHPTHLFLRRSHLFNLPTLVVLLLSLSWQPAAAYTERNLLQRSITPDTLQKYLLTHQEWVPYPAYTDRAGWDRLMGHQKERLIEAGEKLLDYQWQWVPATAYLEFERSGNRDIMQKPFNANRNALHALLFAELAEGKGRFIDALINGVYLSCGMPSWVLSAHLPAQKIRRSLPDFREQIIDLGSGSYAAILAWIHYFFHDTFDRIHPTLSLQLRHALEERILTPYLHNRGMHWMAFRWKPGAIINNWNPWCNSNVLQCFLLLEKDPKRLQKAVYQSIQSVDRFINFVKSDGACEEGTSYWGHAAGKLYDYLQMLHDATGGKVDLFGEPMFRRMGEYISRSYVGNGWVVNFADASAQGGGDPLLIYRYGKAVGSEEMMQFAAHLLPGKKKVAVTGNDVFRSLQSLLYQEELAQCTPRHRTPEVTWYPETEFCYLRNDNGLFLAAKGGFNNESHNHNDVGTFSLYLHTVPMLIDAGVGTYTKQTFGKDRYSIWTMQSDYHNLPRINGVSQRYGQSYRASKTSCCPKRKQFSLNLATAYPAEAQVETWHRSYRLEKKALVMDDRFVVKKAVAPHQLCFLTWGQVSFPAPGKIILEVQGKKLEMTYPTCFQVQLETLPLKDPRLTKVWGKEIYRLVLTDTAKRRQGHYRCTFRQLP